MNVKHLEPLRARMPDTAKDIRINLQSLLGGQGSLSPAQRWGCALASAAVARNGELLAAVAADAREIAGEAAAEDALAAATLMAMNNVFYRSRHMLGEAVYGQRPARLRMTRLAQPRSSKADLELFSLAASAIGGCEVCLQAHERVAIESGFTQDQVFDAIRVAAVIQAAAVALETAAVVVPQSSPIATEAS